MKTRLPKNQLTLQINPPAETLEWIHDQIQSYRYESDRQLDATPEDEAQLTAVLLSDNDGRLIGGITGKIFWGWLILEEFFIAEENRNQGWGTRMLTAIEKHARQRGCLRALVVTYRSKIVAFFQQRGYRTVGKVEDFPPGETQYTLRKDL